MKIYPVRILLGVFALGSALLCRPPELHAQGLDKQLIVGVFNRSIVVQVFYRSEAWKAKLQSLIDARHTAALNSDGAKVSEIEDEMQAMQSLAQKQLAGDAPLTNILDTIKSDWPDIAKEAGVDVIVEATLYRKTNAVLVDVTPFILKRLTARKTL